MNAPAGTRGTGHEMVAERGKIRGFAAATPSRNPACPGPDAIVLPAASGLLTSCSRLAIP
jgi:hypothetical protein